MSAVTIDLQSQICEARRKLVDSKKRRLDLAEALAHVDPGADGVVDSATDDKIAELREAMLGAQIDLLDAQMRLVEMGGTP